MRPIAMLAILLMTAGHAVAGASVEDIDHACTSMAKAAEAIMNARQTGMPMEQLMGYANGSAEPVRTQSREMVIAAFAIPSFDSEPMRQKAMREFKERYQVLCYKILAQ